MEHVGSAHGDEQLAVLLAIARERIGELAGRVPFDLDGRDQEMNRLDVVAATQAAHEAVARKQADTDSRMVEV